MIALGEACLADGRPGHFQPLSFSSSLVRRVCRSTVQAEAYNLDLCIEEADLIRAALADAAGRLDPIRWETTAAAYKHMVWFSDCKSVVDTLLKINQTKIADKRLGITIAAMRQSLWREPGTDKILPRLTHNRPGNTTDSVMWIDTMCMLVDAMTKSMEGEFLTQALDSNYWNITQPEIAKQIKLRKQLQRRSKRSTAPVDRNPKIDESEDEGEWDVLDQD